MQISLPLCVCAQRSHNSDPGAEVENFNCTLLSHFCYLPLNTRNFSTHKNYAINGWRYGLNISNTSLHPFKINSNHSIKQQPYLNTQISLLYRSFLHNLTQFWETVLKLKKKKTFSSRKLPTLLQKKCFELTL